MCQNFYSNPSFYQSLIQMDQQMAMETQAKGCPRCGGSLHVSNYPRKPRGFRSALDSSYNRRLSFCCGQDGCRRRMTPPSVRFLGRKVYSGTLIILLTALTHGLPPHRRKQLIEKLDLWPQTLYRWKFWWQEGFANSRTWKLESGLFMPPITIDSLPGALLGRLKGDDLAHRFRQFLSLLTPLTTTSWSGRLMGMQIAQKM